MKNREQLITEMDWLFIQLNKKFKQAMNDLFDGEITFAEFIFLRYLEEAGPSRSSDAAATFHVSLAHITTMCDRLIKKGFIYRHRPETDRRTIEIGLNEDGRKALEKYRQIRRDFVTSLYSKVSDEELSQLVAIYQKVINQFESQKG